MSQQENSSEKATWILVDDPLAEESFLNCIQNWVNELHGLWGSFKIFPLSTKNNADIKTHKYVFMIKKKWLQDEESLFIQELWRSMVWLRSQGEKKAWEADTLSYFIQKLPMPGLFSEDQSNKKSWQEFGKRLPEVTAMAFGWSPNVNEVLCGSASWDPPYFNQMNNEVSGSLKKLISLLQVDTNKRNFPDYDPKSGIPLTRDHILYSMPFPLETAGPSKSEKEGGTIYTNIILEKYILRTTTFTLLKTLLERHVHSISMYSKSILRAMTIEESYSRINFESNINQLAKNLRTLVLFTPEYAGMLIRRLAIQYACYVRENFGTRVSPNLFQQYKNNDLHNDRKVLEQSRFLAQVTAVAIILTNPHEKQATTDSQEFDSPSSVFDPIWIMKNNQTSEANSYILPFMGHLLSGHTRIYQKIFQEMYLLDMAGSIPVLSHMMDREEFREEIQTLLKITKIPVQLSSEFFKKHISLVLQGLLTHPTVNTEKKGSFTALGWEKCFLTATFPIEQENNPLKKWDTWHLHELLGRWLGLIAALETDVVDGESLFSQGDEAKSPKALEALWTDTEGLMTQWLRFHKQWNTIADDNSPNCGEGIREYIESLLSRESDSSSHSGTIPETTQARPLFLHIDSLWLNMYLIMSISRNMPFNDLRKEYFPSPYLAVSFLKRFGNLVLYVLWSLIQHEECPEFFAFKNQAKRLDRDKQTTPERLFPVNPDVYADTLIDMVDIYAHYILKLPFEVQVSRILNWFLVNQAALYTLKSHYRDHVFHVIDVFLLGDFLLRCRIGKNNNFIKDTFQQALSQVRPEEKDDKTEEGKGKNFSYDLFQNWCIAGLFHDIGYLFIIYGIIPDLLNEHAGQVLAEFICGMNTALSGKLDELEKMIQSEYHDLIGREKKLCKDHGALSTLIIKDHMKKMDLSEQEEKQIQRFNPAFCAIFMHGLHHRPVFLGEHPLAYLLTLCDEIQDWGRNRTIQQQFRKDITLSINTPLNWQVRAIPVLSELLLEFQYAVGTDVLLQAENSQWDAYAMPQITMYQRYQAVDDDLLDPLFLWIGKAMNLERLRANRWAHINLHILTDVPDKLRRMELTYEDLLCRIADRYPKLNLRRFVHILKLMWDKHQPHDKIKRLLEPLKNSHTLDWIVFDLEKMAQEHPLRAFDPEEGFPLLGTAKTDILREIEERYRYQGSYFWKLKND